METDIRCRHVFELTLVTTGLVVGLGACRSPGDLTFSRGNCAFGQAQVGENCVVIAGSPCHADGTCLSGECIVDGDEEYCTTVCASDSECPPGFLCMAAGDASYCRKDRGVLGRCREDADCGKCGTCVQGYCRESQVCIIAVCDSDDDCGRCRKCEGGGCIPIEDCGPACESSADCLPEEICTFDHQGALACLPRVAGGFASPCSSVTGLQCESGACLYGEGVGSVYDTYCSSQCADAAHSTDCPPGYRCREYPPFDDGNNYCVHPDKDFPEDCDSRYDCGNGLACRFGVSKDQQRITSYCASGVPNGAGVGRNCGAETDCLSGICPENGICTTPCVVDNDCPEPYLCRELRTAQFSTVQIAFRGCLHASFVKGGLGDECPTGDAECESGFCTPGAEGGPLPYCTVECSPEAPCPQPYTCASAPDGTSACGRENFSGDCQADADCPAGSICAAGYEDGNLFLNCREPDTGEPKAGETCDMEGAGKACQSGICVDDLKCGAFCRTAADCPGGYLCRWGGLATKGDDPYQDRIVALLVCRPDPGSRLACHHDAGCPAGEVCRADLWPTTGEVQKRCHALWDGMKPAGEGCSENFECTSGVCLGNSRCTTVCAVDTDCGPDEVCAQVAVYVTDSYARPVLACRPSPETGDGADTGMPCPLNGTCASDFCFTGPDQRSFCAGRCRDNLDCLGSFTICRIEPGYGNVCTPADYRPVE